MHYYAGCVFTVHSELWPKMCEYKGWKIVFLVLTKCVPIENCTCIHYTSHSFSISSYLPRNGQFNARVYAWHLLLAQGFLPVSIERLATVDIDANLYSQYLSGFQYFFNNLFANTHTIPQKMVIKFLFFFVLLPLHHRTLFI